MTEDELALRLKEILASPLKLSKLSIEEIDKIEAKARDSALEQLSRQSIVQKSYQKKYTDCLIGELAEHFVFKGLQQIDPTSQENYTEKSIFKDQVEYWWDLKIQNHHIEIKCVGNSKYASWSSRQQLQTLEHNQRKISLVIFCALDGDHIVLKGIARGSAFSNYITGSIFKPGEVYYNHVAAVKAGNFW